MHVGCAVDACNKAMLTLMVFIALGLIYSNKPEWSN